MPSSNLNSNFISETKTNEKLSPLFLHCINFIDVIKDVFLNESCKNIVWVCIMMDGLAIRKYSMQSKAENYTPKPNLQLQPKHTQPQRIYNPITTLGFSAMFTSQLQIIQGGKYCRHPIYPFILRPRFLQFLKIWFEKSGSRNLVREIWFENSG